jgi:hypothetical protein
VFLEIRSAIENIQVEGEIEMISRTRWIILSVVLAALVSLAVITVRAGPLIQNAQPPSSTELQAAVLGAGFAYQESLEDKDSFLTEDTGFSAESDSARSPLLAQRVTASDVVAAPADAAQWTIDAVDTASDFGAYASVAIDSRYDTLYISYYDATNGDLRLASPVAPGTGNCGPENGWWCRTVYSTDDVGQYSSIDIWQGLGVWKLGISYYNATNGALEYAEYREYISSWEWISTTIDTGDSSSSLYTGLYTSLKFDSTGTPHIAYHDSRLSEDGIKYTRYVGGGTGDCGGGDWNCDLIEGPIPGVGRHASLALNESDEPRIAYYRKSDGALRYAQYLGSLGNCGPDNVWQCDTIDTATGSDVIEGIGPHVSLHVDEGILGETPVIAYYDAVNDTLKYANYVGILFSSNCGPDDTWNCSTIEDVGFSTGAMGVSLDVDNAGATIAYHDVEDGGVLKVAQPVSRLGLESGNCGPLGGFPLHLTWQCDTVDDGIRDVYTHTVGQYPAIALHADGLASIAYYDGTDGDLSVAYQEAATTLTPTIHALPTAIRPGGQVHVSGYGFSAGGGYYAYARPALDPDPPSVANDWVPVVADSDGLIRTTLPLTTTLEAGDYKVVVRTHPIAEPALIVNTDLTIEPAVTLELDPTSGPPGTLVQFTAGNLTPGSLRLDYDGVPLLGPFPISGSSYSGAFTVPGDRPNPLGLTTTVGVLNLVNGIVVGAAEAECGSQASPPPPTYIFTNVVVPTRTLQPGELFTITGQIVPPPPTDQSVSRILAPPSEEYYVTAIGYSPEGDAAPIDHGVAQVGSDGAFALPAYAPGQQYGDSWTVEEETNIDLILGSKNDSNLGTHQVRIGGPNPLTISVIVSDIDSGDPISKAIVHLLGTYSLEIDRVAFGHISQMSAINSANPWNEDSFLESVVCNLHPHAGMTDNSGQVMRTINPVDTFTYPMLENVQDEYAFYGIGAATASNPVLTRLRSAAWEPPPLEWWEPFVLTVDGLRICYGVPDGQGGGLAQFYSQKIYYNPYTGDLKDESGAPILGPITVLLKSLDPSQCPFVGGNLRLEPGISLGQQILPGVSMSGTVYGGGYYSWLPVRDDPLVDKWPVGDQMKVEFDVDGKHAAQVASARLYLDGNLLGPFEMESKDHLCEGEGGGPPVVYYSYTIDDNEYAYWSEGLHVLKIELEHAGGGTSARYLGVQFERLPDWFLNPLYEGRYIGRTYGPLLKGTLTPPAATLNADVPRVGHEENEANSETKVEQHLGSSGAVLSSQLGSKALNKPGASLSRHNNGAGASLEIPRETKTIVDTGRIPVYRDSWGIWPIASAQFGCDVWFHADVTYGGNVTFNEMGGADVCLDVIPSAVTGVDMWLDVSILCGIIEGSVHAVPDIGMSMPMRFHNGSKQDLGACFWYHLHAWYYGKIGCCKCGLCKKSSGMETLFSGSTCGASTLASHAGYSTAQTQPPLVEALEAAPELTTDGFGNTYATYMTAGGNLTTVTWDGLDWSEPMTTTVHTTTAPSGWQRADFADGQAVLVWSASDWTQADWESSSTTISDAHRSRYIAYALWDGLDWSEPMSLTHPSTGDGSVALAACPQTTPGCPAGGAVTAVWVRDEAGSPAQQELRLHYATYQNGDWSTPQPVDPASTTTDAQPDVVYVGDSSSGLVPLVVWVRDGDGDVATVEDRKIAMRRLGPGGVTELPAGLPGGVIEVAVAADGNGDPRLAFTRIEEYASGQWAGLLDNRHVLYTGRMLETQTRQAAAGATASWTTHQLKDALQRPIRAEYPELLIDNQGQATIVFRGLGFGPTPDGEYILDPAETVGIKTGAGDLAQVEVDFQGTPHNPVYFTSDGGGYYGSSAVYDPVSDSVVAVAVRSASIALAAQRAAGQAPGAARARTLAEDDLIVFASAPRQPDFRAMTMTVSSRYPLAGEPISVEVEMRNDGVAWQGSVTDTLNVLATWDGGPGVGSVTGTAQLTALDAGVPVTVTLTVTAPASSHVLHTLFVTVNPTQTITEMDGTNNSLSTVVGGLRPPSDVIALAETGSPLVFLQWPDVDDPRIAGYRVYRATDDEPPMPVGSTLVTGFVDLTSELDHTYHYTVTSYMTTGVESGPSNVVQVTLGSWRTYLPLVLRGFSSSGIQQREVPLALQERSLIRRREVR